MTENLLWLWLVVPFGVVGWLVYQRLGLRLRAVAPRTDAGTSPMQYRPGAWTVKVGLVGLSLVLMILALARPRLGYEWREVSRTGVDLMVVVDVSRSMLAEDVSPNRLEGAKREVMDLLSLLQGDRVGLVAFAGVAFVQCPLTADYNAARQFLSFMDTDLIPVQGTNIADAIAVSLDSLKEAAPEGSEGQAILLMTDGEDLADQVDEAIVKAQNAGVKIFTMGVGRPLPTVIPLGRTGRGGTRDLLSDANQNTVRTKLDEASLKTIALSTGGLYVNSVAGMADLEQLYSGGIKTKISEQEYQTSRERLWYERYQWFLGLAIALLTLEWFLPYRRFLTPLICLLGLGWGDGAARAADVDSAEQAFRSGQYEDAASAYGDAEDSDPGDPRHVYNRAVSQYMSQDYEGAAQGFAKARELADGELRQRSEFNRGNALVGAGKLEEAIKAYQNALAMDNNDAQAEQNLKHVEKILEEQKKQKQQQQNQQNQDNQQNQNQPPQNQDNQQEQNQSSKPQAGQPNEPDQNQQQEQNQPEPQDDPGHQSDDQNNQNNQAAQDPQESQNQQHQQDPQDQQNQQGKDQTAQNSDSSRSDKPSEAQPQGQDPDKQENEAQAGNKPDESQDPRGDQENQTTQAAGNRPAETDPNALNRQQAERLLRGVQDFRRKYMAVPYIDPKKIEEAKKRGKDW